MTATPHFEHRLDAWLDGRLDSNEHAVVERHLRECADCRRRRDALAVVRGALRAEAAPVTEPAAANEHAELRRRVLAALDEEDAAAALRPPAGGGLSSRRTLLLAAATMVAVVGLARWLPRRRPNDAVAALVDDYAQWAHADLPATLGATTPASIEARWKAAGVSFPARVLDLAMMGVELEGGDGYRLATIGGRSIAARTIYRAGEGRVVCTMWRGDLASLPATTERRHGNLVFRVYRRGAITVVVWQEGPVLCALASAGDPEAVAQLAFAKAMAPAVEI